MLRYWRLEFIPQTHQTHSETKQGGSHLFISFISTQCQGHLNSGRWGMRLLVPLPLFAPQYTQMLHPKWHRSPVCEPELSSVNGLLPPQAKLLTSGTFKYATSNHSCFESLRMCTNPKSWQSVDIWTHFQHLFLSSLNHLFFFFFLHGLCTGIVIFLYFFNQNLPTEMETLWLSVTPIGAWLSAAVSDWWLTHLALIVQQGLLK